jgi:uncharacterized membrane protein YphA (DoxX/SURF4 family)
MTGRFASKSAAAHTSGNRVASSTNVPARQDSPARSRRTPSPSAGWTGTTVRLLFGVIFGIDAALKWLPGYRDTFLIQLKSVAVGQPAWLHGWFQFWISLQSSAPAAFATVVGLTETGLALVLLLGVARRAGYIAGVMYPAPVGRRGRLRWPLPLRLYRHRDGHHLCAFVRRAAHLRAARPAGTPQPGPGPGGPAALVALCRRAPRRRPGARRPARGTGHRRLPNHQVGTP